MSRPTYNNNPSTIAINRITYDRKQIEESKQTLELEGLYFDFPKSDNFDTRYKMLIIGPEDTPYEGGFYMFDAQFPDQYPFHPMTMKTRTQGGGVRKHPNLYTCGKCCFSFLGTWSGPPWTACQNPKTVAASIRSVLTEYPLENEPGWEKIKDNRQKAYSRLISFFNIKWGVVSILEKIPSSFKSFEKEIISTFIRNYGIYVKNLEKFSDINGTTEVSPTYGFSITYDYEDVKNRLEALFKKYSPKPHVESVSEKQENPTETISKKSTKIKIIKKTPSQSAKDLELGTIMENKEGVSYIVKSRVRDGKNYNVWCKYKE